MTCTLAIIGRPNVGKSTLFNCLTQSRDAIVANIPGVTRDRHYGAGKLGNKDYIVVDTGGIIDEADLLTQQVAKQAWQAIDEADQVLFVVDAKAGLTAADQSIVAKLRTYNKPMICVVNKVDGLESDLACSEFHQLGFGAVYPVAASHRRGVIQLMEDILAALPEKDQGDAAKQSDSDIKIAIIGRPNVGKSTLVNRILGEVRVLASDLPGTTRDSLYLPLERHGERYTLIDTAGVRRKGRVHDVIEKFSILKTLKAVEAADVVLLVMDARENISDQDLHLLGFILETGRSAIITVNKWDGLEESARQHVKDALDRRLQFANFIPIKFISALHGSGVGNLFPLIRDIFAAANQKLPTPKLTRILQEAITQHQPPMVSGRRIKLRYAHAGGHKPPTIIIHGNQVNAVPLSYRTYLAHVFRKVLGLQGTPLKIEFKSGENPYQH